MCGSMVDIQSPTAEIRQGKKKKKPQDENIYGLPYYVGQAIKKVSKTTYLHGDRLGDREVPDLLLMPVRSASKSC